MLYTFYNSNFARSKSLSNIKCYIIRLEKSEAKFKECGPRFKFKLRLNYGWFQLKLYQMFQDSSRRSI